MPTCTCEIPPEMAQAGRAATICHHTSLDRLTETELALASLMSYFTHQFPVDDLFDTPMRQVATKYAVSLLGSQKEFDNMTEVEYLIITAAFLKQASLAIQALCTSLYLRIAEENEPNP